MVFPVEKFYIGNDDRKSKNSKCMFGLTRPDGSNLVVTNPVFSQGFQFY